MEVSIEWYFIANFMMTAAILTNATRRMGRFRPGWALAGALLGAAGAVARAAGIFPDARYEVILLPASLCMALGKQRIKVWLRGAAWCAALTALSAGAVMFVTSWFRVNALWTTAIFSLAMLAAGLLFPGGGAGEAPGEVRVRIATRMGAVEISAMIDTGNRLREPFSGLPVMIVSSDCLSGILDPVCFDENALLPPGFRVVRYRVLGGGGYMRCFRPASISRLQGKRWIPTPDMWVAIYSGSIPGALDALAPPSV